MTLLCEMASAFGHPLPGRAVYILSGAISLVMSLLAGESPDQAIADVAQGLQKEGDTK